MSEPMLRPFGLGGFQMTAWLCFNALLCDLNRPEMVIDWDGGKGADHDQHDRRKVVGEVIYRDQNTYRHFLPVEVDEVAHAFVGAPAPEADDVLGADGPCQWDDLETLR